MNSTQEPKPNLRPGAPEAIDAGCLCSPEFNNHGKFPPSGGDWWIRHDCPLHNGWLALPHDRKNR